MAREYNPNDYKDSYDEKEEPKLKETTSSSFGLGNLVGGFIIILLGFSLMGTITEQLESPEMQELNLTNPMQEVVSDLLPNLLPLSVIIMAIVFGGIIIFLGLRSGGLLEI